MQVIDTIYYVYVCIIHILQKKIFSHFMLGTLGRLYARLYTASGHSLGTVQQ